MIGVLLLLMLSAGVLFSVVCGFAVLGALQVAFAGGDKSPLAVALLATIMLIAVAIWLVSGIRGAMSADEFRRVLLAPLLLGAAPGTGMLVGRLLLLFR